MYKIIQDDKIIDIIRYPKFIKFLASGHIAMTDKNSAQGIVGSDDKTLYSFIPVKEHATIVVKAEPIDEAELSRLSSLLSSGQTVSADESALMKAKNEKLRMLSGNCKNKITAGFTVELSDGKQSFKLTTEDQLNLVQIENQLNSGESYFVYHATNQPCKLYSKEDMSKVVRAFRKHVLYHTTYYNMAKQYIKSLTDIEKVNLFSYGVDISETVEDAVLRQIIKNGGS
jgi:ribosome biogenesis protein Nip4